MGQRQKDWARRARKALRALLGGRCALCGSRRKLEFDCISARGHRHHRIEVSARTSFYRLQHSEGNLQLLCSACHGDKSAADSQFVRSLATDSGPF